MKGCDFVLIVAQLSPSAEENGAKDGVFVPLATPFLRHRCDVISPLCGGGEYPRLVWFFVQNYSVDQAYARVVPGESAPIWGEKVRLCPTGYTFAVS